MTWERGRWRREKSLPSPARFSHFFLLNNFPPLSRSLEQATPTVICCLHPRSSPSIKIGIDLSLHKSIKIGKSDLIDIDCIDQSVEIDDTLVSFIDLTGFYRFHPFISEDTSECSPVHPKMKTAFMQTVNLLTIE